MTPEETIREVWNNTYNVTAEDRKRFLAALDDLVAERDRYREALEEMRAAFAGSTSLSSEGTNP